MTIQVSVQRFRSSCRLFSMLPNGERYHKDNPVRGSKLNSSMVKEKCFQSSLYKYDTKRKGAAFKKLPKEKKKVKGKLGRNFLKLLPWNVTH